MSSLSKLKNKKIPQHVAIIMDGNGRWAKTLGKERSFGHQKGIDSVKHSLEASLKLNIKYLTLFAFSKENWERPSLEIKIIMVQKIPMKMKIIMDLKNIPLLMNGR